MNIRDRETDDCCNPECNCDYLIVTTTPPPVCLDHGCTTIPYHIAMSRHSSSSPMFSHYTHSHRPLWCHMLSVSVFVIIATSCIADSLTSLALFRHSTMLHQYTVLLSCPDAVTRSTLFHTRGIIVIITAQMIRYSILPPA